jgi:hypothetical protein
MRFSKLLLLVGLVEASVFAGCGNRRASSSFTEVEARERIGERVRCIRDLDDATLGLAYDQTGLGIRHEHVGLVTFCEETGSYLNLKKGDVGTVIDFKQFQDGAYFLVAHWARCECEQNIAYLSKFAYEELVENSLDKD